MANLYPQCPLPPNTGCLTFLTRSDSMGLSVAAEAGFVSAAAVLVLFCMIIRKVVRNIREPPAHGWRIFKSPLDVYMLSLLSSDLLQSLGKILHVKWLHDGVVQCGGYCTAQGITQQLGETGVAQATLAIAVHTFVMIFFRKGAEAIRVAVAVVVAIWLFLLLFIAISASRHTKGDERYITPTPYWCWINQTYTGGRLGEYFWLWFSAFFSLALYVPLFLCLRGNLKVDQEKWWLIRWRRNPSTQDLRPARNASIMLLYPASYIVLVLPDSICRWKGLDNIPPPATFFGTTLFGLSGLVNVCLLLYTRPGLLLLSDNEQHPAPGPVFESSQSIASGIEERIMRLRATSALWNMGDSDSNGGQVPKDG